MALARGLPQVEASTRVQQAPGHILLEELSELLSGKVTKQADLPLLIAAEKGPQEIRLIPVAALPYPIVRIL